MRHGLAITALAVFTLGGAAFAQEQDKQAVLDKYERTGEMQNCVPLFDFEDSTVLDDQTILFDSGGDRAYLNTLPQTCPQLSRYDSFTYSTNINQLCDDEIITVIDTASDTQLNSCQLGKFEVLKRKED